MAKNSPAKRIREIEAVDWNQMQGNSMVTAKLNLQLLDVQSVAKLFGIHPRTVWRMVAAGDLPEPVRLGPKTARWRLVDLKQYLDALT